MLQYYSATVLLCYGAIVAVAEAEVSYSQVSTDFDPSTCTSLCLAQRDFNRGEQFTIFFGVRANCDLLVLNGFVFADNQSDCITIR